jgi:dCTP deaminase
VQSSLKRAVEEGHVVFTPALTDDQWGPASVNLRLGFSFTKLNEIPGAKISVAGGLRSLSQGGYWATKTLRDVDEHGKPEAFDPLPNEFVLAMTHEVVKVPNDMIALVEGRTTYARVGLSMHQTAPWIQPGFEGPIILEVRNSGPLTIVLTPLVDRPCQLVFFKLTEPLPDDLLYGARATDIYQRQEHPLKRPK